MGISPTQSIQLPPGAIICAGEALIDLIAPPADDWSGIEHFVPRIGGAPANTSVCVRRLGGHAAFLGCLAEDEPGQWIRARLLAEGVDISAAPIIERAPTRLALVTGPVDNRDFDFYGSPAVDTLLTPEHVRSVDIYHAGAVIAGSLALLSEPSRSAMRVLLERCAERDIPVAFDPNPRPKTWPDPAIARSEMTPFIEQASILKLGREEPAILGLTIEEIREMQPDGAIFVLSDGANGCRYWYGGEGPVTVPAVSVKSVDSTGAGDAFTAALTLRFVEQNRRISLADVQFASIVGALTTTSQGAMDALPHLATVEQFMKRHAFAEE